MTHYFDVVVYIVLTAVFAMIAVVDVKSRRIPNLLLLVAVVINVAHLTIHAIMDVHYMSVVLKTLLATLLVTAICALAWKYIAKGGIIIGGGDLKYLIILSFCLDANKFSAALLISIALLFFAWSIAFIRCQRDVRIPGGLFLSAGAITVSIYGCIHTIIANNLLF